MCFVWIVFALVLALIFLLQNSIRYLLPRHIIKVTRPTVGSQQWSERATDMVIKFLANPTPLDSIMANILMVCRLIFSNNNIVGCLPGVDFVHKRQSVLAVETKTLGGYRIAKAVKVLEHHSNDTSCRGLSFSNSILKIATKDGYEKLALLLAIFPADGMAKIGIAAI